MRKSLAAAVALSFIASPALALESDDRPPVVWQMPLEHWDATYTLRFDKTELALKWVVEPPPAALVPHTSGTEQWRSLVVTYWPAGLVEWALAIISCESNGVPSAKNRRSSAAGLFQFLRSTWDRGPAPALGLDSYDSGAVYDPETNIRAAAWLYANWGGKSQWSCRA